MDKRIFKFCSVLLLGLFFNAGVKCQKIAVKTNLLYDIPALTANAGVEFGLAPRWTLDVSANLGAHLLGGQFNIGGVKNHIHFLGSDFSQVGYRRYQGWMIGAGVAYGYAWILGKHWNVEGEIGLGWIYTRYDSYPCANCGKKLAKNKTHNYVGPTKAAVNLVYTF